MKNALFPTGFSIASTAALIALGLTPAHDPPPLGVAWGVLVFFVLSTIWHFTEVRRWRSLTRAQAVVWCLWSLAVVSFVAAFAFSIYNDTMGIAHCTTIAEGVLECLKS